MARKFFILAIFLMAGSAGVLGYQVGNYLIVETWPAVPLHILWTTFFGVMSESQRMPLGWVWARLGAVPLMVAGIVVAFVCFLISDTLRQH
jgi:hypothetical protein